MSSTDFKIDDWTVRPQRGLIERAGELVRVKPKAMEVLVNLASANGEVVSRNELFEAVWPGSDVSDDVLTQCIVELRKAFGDSAKDARIIETIPRRGFRLVPAEDPKTHVASAEAPIKLWLIAVALVIVMVTGAVLLSDFRDSAPATRSKAKSLAVLPFVDMSAAGDQAHFADGLSEELITKLSRLQGLLVTGRTSSFRFRGTNEDLRKVGDILGVNHVLEGSVRKSAEEIRVTAQLIDVTSGFHLWADTYDRPLEDIFAVQEEIAEAVATALSITMSVGALGAVEGGTTNVEAFVEATLGNAVNGPLTVESFFERVGHFKRATEIDPEFANAWGRLALEYRISRMILDDSYAWRPLSEDALARAMALAPNSPFVLKAATLVYADIGDWAAAQHAVDRAEEVAAKGGLLSFPYIDVLVKTGRRTNDALATAELALLREPLWAYVYMYVGHLYAMQGRTDDALAELERGYGKVEMYGELINEGIVVALSADDRDELQKWLARAVRYEQTLPGKRVIISKMQELLDQPEVAVQWLHTVFANDSEDEYWIALWAAYFGDTELALAAMRREPDAWALWLPVMSHVRRTPGFKEYVRDIGLMSFWQKFGWGDFCRPTGDEDFECR